jgi:hypothetical protein
MSILKLKSIVRRGSILGAALAVVAAAIAPASMTFADALNPLTQRSLTLSSSSPGWANTDGSGNSTYAPPNSGANGQKSGNYFSFRTSTNSDTVLNGGTGDPITEMSFQYCTNPAGQCTAPGDDKFATPAGSDDASHADLNVNYPSALEVDNSDFATVIDTGTTATAGSVKAVPGYTNHNPKYIATGSTNDPAEAAKSVAGNFIVMYFDATANSGSGGWVQSTGWTATSTNQEEATVDTTGKNNTILLAKTTGGGLGLPSDAQVKVLFFATTNDYITNPGSGAFFVKINTFKNFDALSTTPGSENTLADNVASGDVIDGGVTVANVMNQSIQITTKVLETMQFSVGTVDPDTLSNAQLGVATSGSGSLGHQVCDTVKTSMVGGVSGNPQNVLELGDQTAESSLKTDQTYATHSYWRLSSNSSAGATVYYSGHTLSNTSGDEIKGIGTTAKSSAQGAEQFGLAMDTKALPGSGTAYNAGLYGVDYSTAGSNENAADNAAAGLVAGSDIDNNQLVDLGATGTPASNFTALNESFHLPRLDPLHPTGDPTTKVGYYGNGSGTITNGGTAKFAFDTLSDTVPTPIASENAQVVDCVTAKMRYIANIAATTPAGIYTTKINYIAAPQY